jgi:hypothetical protein
MCGINDEACERNKANLWHIHIINKNHELLARWRAIVASHSLINIRFDIGLHIRGRRSRREINIQLSEVRRGEIAQVFLDYRGFGCATFSNKEYGT